MYSIFIENKAIINYFFKYQLTKLLLSIKTKPEVDFWLFLSIV